MRGKVKLDKLLRQEMIVLKKHMEGNRVMCTRQLSRDPVERQLPYTHYSHHNTNSLN